MIGSQNTCSRCRFFTDHACATRACYDWRADRSERQWEAEWEEDEPEEQEDKGEARSD